MRSKTGFIYRLMKSASALLSADAVQLTLMVGFSILLGRAIGIELFGVFSLSFVLCATVRTLVEAGFSINIPRAVSADPSAAYDRVKEAQGLKNIIWAAAMPLAAVVGYSLLSSWEFIILLLWILPWSIASTYRAALRGIGEMAAIAKVENAAAIALYSFNFLFLYIKPELSIFFSLFVIFEVIKSIIYRRILKKKKSLSIPSYLSMWAIKGRGEAINAKILKEQFHLTAVNFLSVLQYRLSMMTLGCLGTPAMLGEFSAGMRFMTSLRALPGAALNTLLPEFSKNEIAKPSGGPQKDDKKKLILTLILSTVIGAVVSISLFAAAEPLIRLTFDFDGAIPALKTLAWTFIPIMYNFTLEAFLLSRKMERSVNLSLMISCAIIFTAACFLIPIFGPVGAAGAAIAGETALSLIYSGFVVRYFQRG